ncbi:MAG: Ppx/GppA family phosphatase [Rhodospirillaceae bacterium]|nr:Ppx/GppA family phosphatase [Rhodospirillaceae bacterium]
MRPRTERSRERGGIAGPPVGVIDIGSNSIRLVIYDGSSRAPVPIFNEKVLCALGRGLERSGMLNADGVKLALTNLTRFAALTRSLNVGQLDVVATAAVREAKDGGAFAAEVERRTRLDVRVLSGGEEATLSALGVVSGIPEADGLVGDLGGGSLELIEVSQGRPGRQTTLPLGPLRLKDVAEGGRSKLRDHIDNNIQSLTWLPDVIGRDFYVVGGAWRSLARLHMAQTNYPLRVIHNYVVSFGAADEFAGLVSRLGIETLARISRVSRRRHEALPLAALVLERILRHAQPKRLVFSALGLREGILFRRLSPAVRRRDPLLSTCAEIGKRGDRFPVGGDSLCAWMDPLFPNESGANRRLRLAACMLGDIAWREHPDYRAEIAFFRVLRMTVVGIDHRGRAFLALAAYARHDGDDGDLIRPALQLLDDEGARRAYLVGMALRLAFTISGGDPTLIGRTALELTEKVLTLRLHRSGAALLGEALERRLETLAKTIGRRAVIETESRAGRG